MHYYRMTNHRGGRFFFGAPFIGGLLGGLVGSALFYPRPYYRPYPPFIPYAPYGPYYPSPYPYY